MKKTVCFLLTTLLLLFIASGCGDDNYLDDFSNDDTAAACQYEVSQYLDLGYYALVIASPCADYMDLAAAHLGLAGFDMISIVNLMVESSTDNASDDSAFDIYMTSLISSVSINDIKNIDSSMYYYSLVNTTNGYSLDNEQDAVFIRNAVIGPVESFAYIKSAIDPDGDGEISGCDLNANSVPDEVDATRCALLMASGAADCGSAGMTVDSATYQSLAFAGYANIYNGLEMDTGGVVNAQCPDKIYHHLLFNSSSVVVSSSEKCVGAGFPGVYWNCPYEGIQGLPQTLLETFNNNLFDSLGSLESLGYDIDSEVYSAINAVSADACGVDGSACTEGELQSFLASELGL